MFPKVIDISGLVKAGEDIRRFNEFVPFADEQSDYWLNLRSEDDIAQIKGLVKVLGEEVARIEKQIDEIE